MKKIYLQNVTKSSFVTSTSVKLQIHLHQRYLHTWHSTQNAVVIKSIKIPIVKGHGVLKYRGNINKNIIEIPPQ